MDYNKTQRNATQHNTTQQNSPQHNKTGNKNHAHMLNKRVEVTSSLTKNSAEQNGQKTLQVYTAEAKALFKVCLWANILLSIANSTSK